MGAVMNDGKLNIFDILGAIDSQNIEYYRDLSPEERKQIVPFVLMQWLSCTPDKQQIVLLNEIVNGRVFQLNKHPELLFYLLTLCTSGKRKRYAWKKAPHKTTSFPKAVKVLKDALGYSTECTMECLSLYTNNDVIHYATRLGYQSDFIKDLTTELKKRDG